MLIEKENVFMLCGRLFIRCTDGKSAWVVEVALDVTDGFIRSACELVHPLDYPSELRNFMRSFAKAKSAKE